MHNISCHCIVCRQTSLNSPPPNHAAMAVGQDPNYGLIRAIDNATAKLEAAIVFLTKTLEENAR